MSDVSRRVITGVALSAALVATSGCTRLRGHQGFLFDQALVQTVQPGVDNRQSVQKVLGLPSFAGQFSDNDWYYFSRDTRALAFGNPKAVEQTILHVRFDAAGNVASVETTGLDKIASVNPVKDKTPTLGRKRGFFQDLFGNIGRVGTIGGGAQPNDNTGQ